ncbi:FAD-binding domain-containing protein [Athelia psychrophila]|uniref:FAD-binding domain-containing protein n=1 Tax=Athelia psychrophila TaxID=1759441 RepID=A0A166MHF3_9AGAM|nr:FAD-binding domain-containing protein [Fibularhizoctonia sp. CBS 109695]
MTDSIKKQDPIQEDPLLLAIAEIRKICKESNGGSQCFSFGAHGYYDGARHFLESSSETPRIAVQPGNVANLAQIMKVLARHNVLFAVKGGGHTTNPLFSSTMDVQIYMCRLNDLEYNKDAKTVTVGAGCVWDEVYHEMAKRGRNVVGGDREGGVGIAGYLTGGGYSLKTNQYGLGIDNITKIEVVLPSGEVKVVSEGPLFEALKGGGNNFGIVTQYTLKTHKQGKTWGGSYSFKARKEGPVKAAIVDFITKEKRKEAAMVAAFRYTLDTSGEVKYTISLFCVFDGPEPADDPWQRFEVIQPRIPSKNNPAGWKRLKERDNYQDILAMAELNHIVLADVPPTTVDSEAKIKWALLSKHDARGRFGCIMVKTYTKKLIDAIADETERASEDMKAHKGKLVVMDVWPFLPSIFANSPPAAWPHKQDENFSPLLAYFLWEDKSEDDFWRGRMQTALDNVKKVAIAEHCFADNAPVYCNTSLEDTKVKDIYRDNLEALSALRLTYDPENVMGRTGGFKIPLPKSSKSSRSNPHP